MIAAADCQLLVDPPAEGAWNMAVDETLLNAAASEGVATLRLYQWQRPTLSLGYFQRYSRRNSHPTSGGADGVRRLTGGGALMHDRELTYALALPGERLPVRQPADLYGLVHACWIDVLAEFGVAARLHGEAEAGIQPGRDEPFLCFARRTEFDVVVDSAAGAAKIIGSAQRRRRGAVLQHGGVLLARSTAAPELPGIAEATGLQIAAPALGRRVAEALAPALHVELVPGHLAPARRQAAGQLASSKYQTPAWNRRR